MPPGLCLAGSFTPQVSAEVSFETFSDAEVDESLTETFLYSTLQHFQYFLCDFLIFFSLCCNFHWKFHACGIVCVLCTVVSPSV